MNRDLEIIKKTKISFKSDFIFKKIFSENEDILKSLLEAILNVKITEISTEKDFTLSKYRESDKGGILDVKATINGKTCVNIEMQVVDDKDILDRTINYLARLRSTSIKKGDSYTSQKPIISIAILDFINFYKPNEDGFLSFTEFNLMQINTKNEKIILESFDDKIKLMLIELPKFRKLKPDLNNKLHEWLLALDCKKFEEMEEVMRTDKEIKEAVKQLTILSDDKEVMDAYEKEQDYLRIIATREHRAKMRLEQGIKEGIEKGIIQGKQEGVKETILKLKKSGMEINQIAQILEISIEELNNLINN